MNIIYVLFLFAIVTCQPADTFWDSEEAQTLTKEIQDQLDFEWEQMEELFIDQSNASEEVIQDEEIDQTQPNDQEIDSLNQESLQEEHVQNQESILTTETINSQIQQESVIIALENQTNEIEQQVINVISEVKEEPQVDAIIEAQVNEVVQSEIVQDPTQQDQDNSITGNQLNQEILQAEEQQTIQDQTIDEPQIQSNINDKAELQVEQTQSNIQSNENQVEESIQDNSYEREYNTYKVQESYETDPNEFYRDKFAAEQIESQIIQDGIAEQINATELPIQEQILNLLSQKLTEIEDEYLDGYALIHYGGGCYVKILCYQSTSHPFRHQVIREYSSNNNEDTSQLKLLIENLEKTIQNQNTKIDKIQFQYTQLEQGYLDLQRTLKNLLESKVRRQLSQVNDSKESH